MAITITDEMWQDALITNIQHEMETLRYINEDTLSEPNDNYEIEMEKKRNEIKIILSNCLL
jgi:hypothetical protein